MKYTPELWLMSIGAVLVLCAVLMALLAFGLG